MVVKLASLSISFNFISLCSNVTTENVVAAVIRVTFIKACKAGITFLVSWIREGRFNM